MLKPIDECTTHLFSSEAKTYRVGDAIDLYRDDEGFEIVSLWSGEQPGDHYFTVMRRNGRTSYTVLVQSGSITWVGNKPAWKKRA